MITGPVILIVLLSALSAAAPLLTVIIPPVMLVTECGLEYIPTLRGELAVILPPFILNVPTL